MDTGVIVAIVVGALILIALLVLVGKRGRERKLDTRRHEAHEIHGESEVRGARAQKAKAEADRLEAEARERSALADREGRAADEARAKAEDIHPEGEPARRPEG
jgi:hypothetical protein